MGVEGCLEVGGSVAVHVRCLHVRDGGGVGGAHGVAGGGGWREGVKAAGGFHSVHGPLAVHLVDRLPVQLPVDLAERWVDES